MPHVPRTVNGSARSRLALVLLSAGSLACSGQIDGGPRGSGDELQDLRLPARVWRLSSPQIDAEIDRLFGAAAPSIDLPLAADEEGITNIAANAGVDDGNASQLIDGARSVASWVVMNGPEASRCGATWGTDACVDSFLGWFLASAYRRPPTTEEISTLRSMYVDLRADYDADYAFAAVVRAVLMSPEFLYRTEIGPSPTPGVGRTVMTDHEIATLLSFALTDTAPDEMLLAAAASGSLDDPDERERQVRRLIAASGPVWQRFFWEWLHMDTLESQAIEVGLSDTVRQQMEEEYDAFVHDVIVENDGTLEDLFSASHTFVRPELATHYGLTHPGGELARVELDPNQRGGLLTLGAWLVAHGKRGRDNVVRRGMNIYRDAMCNDIAIPGDGFDPTVALGRLVGPDATVREVVEARGTAGACANCHRVADPVGLVFENFGSDGRWQTTYADGLPVEPMIDLDGVAFDNAPDVSLALTQSSTFRRCFMQRFAHFFVGRNIGTPGASTWLAESSVRFRDNGDRLEELLVALVRHPAFVERQN